LLHQVGDLFELNVKLRCHKVKGVPDSIFGSESVYPDMYSWFFYRKFRNTTLKYLTTISFYSSIHTK